MYTYLLIIIFVISLFPEHKSPRAERFRLVDTVDLDDVDEENTAQVCYFIVGGDEYDTFNLDRFTHELMVRLVGEKEKKHVGTFSF